MKRKSLPDISEGTLNNMASDDGLLLFKQISTLIAKNDSMFYLGEGEQPSAATLSPLPKRHRNQPAESNRPSPQPCLHA